jgi:hypothetical protein
MTADEIQARINTLAAQMVAKGLRNPQAEYRHRSNAAGQFVLTWTKDAATNEGDIVVRFGTGDDIDTAHAEALAIIAGLADGPARKQAAFMVKLGDVIDLGRENGIDVAFVNPLVETMKKLSENALTHQQAA